MAQNATVQSFVDQYGAAASSAASQLGVSQSDVLGQWGEETGWGQHFAGTNNLGNVSPGGSVANYSSVADGVSAYVSAMKGLNVTNQSSAQGFASALGSSGYATDPQYQSSVLGAINTVSGYTPTNAQTYNFYGDSDGSQGIGGGSALTSGLESTAGGAGIAESDNGSTATKKSDTPSWLSNWKAEAGDAGFIIAGAILIIGALLIANKGTIEKVAEIGAVAA